MTRELRGFTIAIVVASGLFMQQAFAADCPYPSSTSISYSGPDQYGHGTVTINYSFGAPPGSPAGGRVTFSAEGPGFVHGESIDSALQSGAWTFPYNVTCWPKGTYKFSSTAGCGPNSTNSTTVTVAEDQPTITMSYSPDAFGHGQWNIHYKFPNTDAPGQRQVTRAVHGPNSVSYDSLPAPDFEGDWNFQYNVTCFKTFDYTFESYGGSCTGKSDDKQQTVSVNSKPTVGLSLDGPDNDGNVTARISYSFPNTDSPGQRSVRRAWYGPFGVSVNTVCNAPEQTGACTFSYNIACWDEKPWQFDATTNSCSGESDTKSDAVTPHATPEVTLGLTRDASGAYTAIVDYEFIQANSRYVRLEVLPTATESGSLLWETVPATSKGTQSITLGTFDTERTIRATAVACGKESVNKEAAVMPSGCPFVPGGGGPGSGGGSGGGSAASGGGGSGGAGGPGGTMGGGTSVGDPVRLWDGGVELNEVDPLPGNVFTRAYSSTLRANGWFGVGWRSIFDAAIVAANTSWFSSVVVELPDRTRAVFRSVSGRWNQTWPQGTAAASLTGSEESGYRYRPAGALLVYVFGSNHKLIGIEDLRTARQTVITYDGSGAPVRVADANGTWSCAVVASNGHVMSIAVDGRPDIIWNYAYSGNLLHTISLGGAAWRTYDYAANRLATVIDALGHAIEQHAYDAVGRATSSFGPSGDIASIEYLSGSTRITRADGSQTTFAQQFAGGRDATTSITGGCASCAGNDMIYAYDARGRVTRAQNGRGFVTQYAYDTQTVNLQSVTAALVPAGCDPNVDAARCRLTPLSLATAPLTATSSTTTSAFVYGDANWPEWRTEERTESAVVAGGIVSTHFVYDATTGDVLEQAITGYTGQDHRLETLTTRISLYDGVESAAFDPGGAFDPSWLALPQPKGLRKTVDGPRADVADLTTSIYYPFDASVPSTWRGRLAAVRNAAGQVTRYERYDVFGNAGVVTDPNGVQTDSTFDALGRVLTTTVRGIAGCDTGLDPLCDRDIVAVRTYLGEAGPLTSQKSANGGLTTYEYDSRSRLAAVTRDVSAAVKERREYAYDAATGHYAAESEYGGAPGAWGLARRDQYRYDAYGRLAVLEHSDSTKIVYEYDAANNVASVQDENHSTANTKNAYDALNRLVDIEQVLGAGSIHTRYGYDVRGNPTSVVDPNGNVTSYAYDDFGRVLQQVSAVTGVTTYAYDAAGNAIDIRDANGITSTRSYDALNRVTTATSVGASGSETVTWSYDEKSAHLREMADPTGATLYLYNRRGQLATEQKTIDGSMYVTRYAYDADGNRTAITYPSGRVVSFSFDLADRPVAAASGTVTYVQSARYVPFGPMTEVVLGNGVAQTLTFDTRQRPMENRLASSAGPIADYVYRTDAAGNILQIHDAIDPAFDRNFGYDDLQRLIAANSGASLWGSGVYAYDSMGNILSLTLGTSRSASFAYNGTTSKLLSATENGASRAVTYDAAGNELNVGDASYEYSPRNRLITGGHRTYAYDGRGVRAITWVPASVASLAITPASAVGGTKFVATVTLTAAAPAGGQTVSLSSTTTSVVAPAAVTVPDGLTTASFDVATIPVAASTIATITASDGVIRRSATFTIEPAHPTLLSITPAEVVGGSPAAATVTLSGAAPSGGLDVAVASSAVSATAPSIVTVAAGAIDATFTVATIPVASEARAAITAAANGVVAGATLTIMPPSAATLTIQPPSVTAGASATAIVTLTGPAPPAGQVVALSSDNRAVSIPASVTVPAGASAATVAVSTASVATTTIATLRATAGNAAATATLTINPPPVVLASLSLSPSSVVGGLPVTATVTLTSPASVDGAVIVFASDDPSLAAVPATVLVPQGSISATVTIDTTTIRTPAVVGITASFNSVSQTSALTITPPPNLALLSLTVAPINVAGGSGATGTVTLTGPAPAGGADVMLMSADSPIVSVPPRVTVRKNDTAATFPIATYTTTTAQTIRVSGTFGGLTQHDAITVIPAAAVQLIAFTVTPPSVSGGAAATGVVTISAPAPVGGIVVSLACKQKNVVTIPPAVTVPGGMTSAAFTIATAPLKAPQHTATISATFASVTLTAELTVTRTPAAAVTFSVDAQLTAPVATPRKYSLYTPELHLLSETETTMTATPAIAFEYIWFAGQPIAQIETATGRVHYYFNDHLGTPILTTDSSGAVDWRIEREPYGRIFAVRAGRDRHQPLALPGQEEEGAEASYNVFRWYRSNWGRYTQADPIGVSASQDLYGYVEQNPSNAVDPLGLIKIYGNWCGPNWTGGFPQPWNSVTLVQRKHVLAPIDALDSACRDHDLCYGACADQHPCDPDHRSDCFKDCDSVLTSRAYAFGGFWGNVIGRAIGRSGRRDPGPNASYCCGPKPRPTAPANCAVVNGQTVCAGTGI